MFSDGLASAGKRSPATFSLPRGWAVRSRPRKEVSQTGRSRGFVNQVERGGVRRKEDTEGAMVGGVGPLTGLSVARGRGSGGREKSCLSHFEVKGRVISPAQYICPLGCRLLGNYFQAKVEQSRSCTEYTECGVCLTVFIVPGLFDIMQTSQQFRTPIGSRSLSQSAMKSRKAAYGNLLMRGTPLSGSVISNTAESDLDSLVARYNLISDLSHSTKRELTNGKTQVADLRAEVGSYQTLLDMGLEALKSDLWAQLSADRNAMAQEVAEEDSFHQMMTEEVRQLNLGTRHTQTVLRDCQRRISYLEGFTGVGRRKS